MQTCTYKRLYKRYMHHDKMCSWLYFLVSMVSKLSSVHLRYYKMRSLKGCNVSWTLMGEVITTEWYTAYAIKGIWLIWQAHLQCNGRARWYVGSPNLKLLRRFLFVWYFSRKTLDIEKSHKEQHTVLKNPVGGNINWLIYVIVWLTY